jgi:hypothetical protein
VHVILLINTRRLGALRRWFPRIVFELGRERPVDPYPACMWKGSSDPMMRYAHLPDKAVGP